jgi:hypothetical protein
MLKPHWQAASDLLVEYLMLRNPPAGQLQIRVFGVIEERSDKLEREKC